MIVLGAGVTGLAAGMVSGAPVLEAETHAGGICSSYYMRPGGSTASLKPFADGEAYRFENGGGHWIFGGDPLVHRWLKAVTPLQSYARRSSVFFSRSGLRIPYPIQNHLGLLGRETALEVLNQIETAAHRRPATMQEWIEQSFGRTLTDLFFAPFHELYTAGLWKRIAPQDDYKSPVNFALALRGAFESTPAVGYNVTFVYPQGGLNALTEGMAERCQVRYGCRVVKIDLRKKELALADGATLPYDGLISTLPLNRMMEIAGLEVEGEPDPYTSVLVLNIGAVRGSRCPDDHWVYVPDSRAGFHRVGSYDNVDASFLPALARSRNDRVGLYVERAFPGGHKPTVGQIEQYAQAVVRELQGWGWIGQAEVVDPTWVEVAYTWAWPNSRWRKRALKGLEEHDVIMVGRYGRWKFQGIADSIKEGLLAGAVGRFDHDIPALNRISVASEHPAGEVI